MRPILLSLLFCGMPGAALAQGATPPDRVDEVVVTGEKANRTLQQTTTSVAVTTPRQIAQENLQQIQDVYDRTANTSETFGASGFTIRGIVNTGVTGAGAADTSTVYLDGAPLPSVSLYGGPTDLWDISQVEILRGPQSTIQGLNALAGSVVINTVDPTPVWSGAARVMLSDKNERTYSAAVGGPLIGDDLALRLSADRIDNDGYVPNTVRGGKVDGERATNLRAKLKWTPSALPGFTAEASYDWARRNGGYQYVFADASKSDYLAHPTSSANRPNSGAVDTDIAALKLGYELSRTLKITSVTSWNQVSVNNFSDTDGGSADAGYLNNRYKFNTLTEEVRLNYAGERLNGLLGLWAYHRDESFDAAQRVNLATPTDTISALLQGGGFPSSTARAIAGAYAQVLPVIPVDYIGSTPNRVNTQAIFGDARYRLTDRLSLIGGFRYDHEENMFASDQQANFAGTLPDPLSFGASGTAFNLAIKAVNAGVLGLVAAASASAPASQRSFDAFLPKAGVSFDWTPAVTTAFTVQRGYRSGGSSQNIAKSTLVPYAPEYSWNYEGSLRSNWLDGTLTVNANLFYVDWTNQQVSVNFSDNTYDYNTVNAGKSHLWGFEVEASHRVSRTFDWYASVGHVETRFDTFILPAGAESGASLAGWEFPFAPRWTAAGGANLHFGGGFVGNLNADWRSAVFTQAGVTQATSRVGARTVANTRWGYETKAWGLYLNVRNLLDEHYAQYFDPTRKVAIVGQPRTVGGELALHW